MRLIKLIELSKSLVSLCSMMASKFWGSDVDTLTKAMVSAELVDYVIGRSHMFYTRLTLEKACSIELYLFTLPGALDSP